MGKKEREVSKNLGLLLKKAREEKGYSLKELENITGISASYIQRLESGERKSPSVKILQILGDALGIDFKQLLDVATVAEDPKDISLVILGTDYYVGDKVVSSRGKQMLMNILNLIISEKVENIRATDFYLELISFVKEFKLTLESSDV